MRKIYVMVFALLGLMGCNSTMEKSVTGIVYDATMNGVTLVADGRDTVFVSTMDAPDVTGGSFFVGDTLTVYYKVVDGINEAARWVVKPAVQKDMLVGSWLKPIVGLEGEDGFKLEEDGAAASINSATLLYKSWKRVDDKVIMEMESIGNGQTIVSTDTMGIVKLNQDSLVLDNRGMMMRYHRGE